MDNLYFLIESSKVYFNILYKLNMDYIKLIGTSDKNLYFEICDSISKLLPIFANTKTKKANVIENDGIFGLLGSTLEFVKNDHFKIVDKYSKILYDIKSLRNSIEHGPHRLTGSTGITDDGIVDITFGCLDRKTNYSFHDYSELNIESYRCNSKDIQKIIMELNSFYSKIKKELILKLEQEDTKKEDKNICMNLFNINYEDFNTLYNQDNFTSICKLINKQ